MKHVLLFFFCSIVFYSFQISVCFSQECAQSVCATIYGDYEDPDSLIGGRYKPARTDIGSAPSNLDEFHILIVFVQFQDEPYSYSTNPRAWNSGQSPNYINNLVKII